MRGRRTVRSTTVPRLRRAGQASMIRTYLRFELRPGAANEFVRLFTDRRIIEQSMSQPGCESAELTVAADRDVAVVTATWRDRAAYEAWTGRPDRADHSDHINRLLAHPVDASTSGEIFEIAAVGSGAGAPSQFDESDGRDGSR